MREKLIQQNYFYEPIAKSKVILSWLNQAIAMAKYPAQEKMALGDSVTDINMSLAADLVLARDDTLRKQSIA
jgi:2-hydroxy-3-keto-5-methylthiopentenyl-1-phosphate phosphatase